MASDGPDVPGDQKVQGGDKHLQLQTGEPDALHQPRELFKRLF